MLKYVGEGTFIPGVPARDLTDKEVKKHGGEQQLIESGLYEKPRADSPQKSKTRAKSVDRNPDGAND